MAQINLLKQQAGPSRNIWEIASKILVRITAVILLALITYYGWLYFRSKSIDKQIVKLQVQIENDQKKAFEAPERAELLTRQQQLKSLDGLIAQHIYWSQLMPKLAGSTLKKATYSNLRITSDGKLNLSVTVPTISDLDKYLQVFDLPEINKYFSNVRIGSFQNVQSKDSTSVRFDVMMDYNPQITKFGGIK